MPENPHHRVIREDTFQSFIRFFRPVADYVLASVLGEAFREPTALPHAAFNGEKSSLLSGG